MTGFYKSNNNNGFTVYCKYTELIYTVRTMRNVLLVVKNKLIWRNYPLKGLQQVRVFQQNSYNIKTIVFGNKHSFVCTLSSPLQEAESLPAFRSPSHAIAKTLLQLAGEFDFEDTFNKGNALIYAPTTYILFITFLITMPILFINLLVSCYSTLMLTEE